MYFFSLQLHIGGSGQPGSPGLQIIISGGEGQWQSSNIYYSLVMGQPELHGIMMSGGLQIWGFLTQKSHKILVRLEFNR